MSGKMAFHTWKEIKADMIQKKKFEIIDHSQGADFLTKVPTHQRCSHCGKIFPLNARGIGGMSGVDFYIVLCPECNLPYKKETWTERKIRSASEELEALKNEEIHPYPECYTCENWPCYIQNTFRMNGKCLDHENKSGGKKS